MTEDSTGGFVPRWLLVRADNAGRTVPIPRTPDESVVPQLADHLRRVAELRGDADLSSIATDYESWYSAARSRFLSQPNPGLAEAYFNRHRIQILKLAVIYEVSSSLSLRVSQAAWARAAAFAVLLEEMIFSLMSTGMSGGGYKRRQMEEKVRSAGEEGVPMGEFTRAFQHTEKEQRDSCLNTLVIAELIHAFRRPTSGRTALFLVHRDVVEAYRARQPGDSPVPTTNRR